MIKFTIKPRWHIPPYPSTLTQKASFKWKIHTLALIKIKKVQCLNNKEWKEKKSDNLLKKKEDLSWDWVSYLTKEGGNREIEALELKFLRETSGFGQWNTLETVIAICFDDSTCMQRIFDLGF